MTRRTKGIGRAEKGKIKTIGDAVSHLEVEHVRAGVSFDNVIGDPLQSVDRVCELILCLHLGTVFKYTPSQNRCRICHRQPELDVITRIVQTSGEVQFHI